MIEQIQLDITVTVEPDVSISRYVVTDSMIIDKLFSFNGSTVDKVDKYIHDAVIPYFSTQDSVETLAGYLFTEPIGRTTDVTMTKTYEDSSFTYRVITYTYWYDTGYDVSIDNREDNTVQDKTTTKIYWGQI